MGPGPRRSLSGPLLAMALATTLGVAALWAAPFLARLVVDGGSRGRAVEAEADPVRVDAFVDRALQAAGLTQRRSRAEVEDVVHETWALPPGRPAEEVAQALRQAARAEGVELHLVARDELDALVRVYAGSKLRRELLLVPTLPSDTPPPSAPNRRERPLLGLIVAGLGQADARALVSTPLPLTVAVRPFQPHSLAVARDAAMAWQEVLAEVEGPALTPSAARAAVPFASGVLLREDASAHLSSPGLEGVVVTTTRAGPTPPAGLLLLGAWRARDRSLDDLLARTTHLLARDGGAAVLVEHDAPTLPGLLRWAAQVGTSRYRLVLAHELARPADTLGIRDAQAVSRP